MTYRLRLENLIKQIIMPGLKTEFCVELEKITQNTQINQIIHWMVFTNSLMVSMCL